MNTFFMVYAEGKETPAVKHEDYDTALKEAQRLSDKLGVSCYILESEPYYVMPRQKEVEKIPPRPVYWFRYEGTQSEPLLKRFTELVNPRVLPDRIRPNEIVFNVGYVAHSKSDQSRLATCAMMFGTELRVKEG
jgi:hypothetical protein